LKVAFVSAELRHNFFHSLGFSVVNRTMYEFQLQFVLELEWLLHIKKNVLFIHIVLLILIIQRLKAVRPVRYSEASKSVLSSASWFSHVSVSYDYKVVSIWHS